MIDALPASRTGAGTVRLGRLGPFLLLGQLAWPPRARPAAPCSPRCWLGGRYWMWFGEGTIHAATSADLRHWTPVADDEHPMHTPTPGQWDATLVEIGAPPVRTADGLLVFLINGATASSPTDVHYRCGQLAVAETDPAKVVARTTEPWLRPTTFEDTHGLVSNVTFVEGLVHFRGSWFAYYGQNDTTLAVAVC